MSDGLLMNLAATEHSDKMTSPHADKYDFDGWYRATITELINGYSDLAREDAAKPVGSRKDVGSGA